MIFINTHSPSAYFLVPWTIPAFRGIPKKWMTLPFKRLIPGRAT